MSFVVGGVDDEPQTGKQTTDDFEDKGRIAETIDIETPGRTHGTDEQRAESVGRINKQKQGK